MTRVCFATLLFFAIFAEPPLSAHDMESGVSGISLPNLEEMTFLYSRDPLQDWNSSRRWTSADGRHMQATILEAYEYGINVRLESGKTQVLTLSKFSEDDQRFIKEWAEMSRFFKLNFTPGAMIPMATDYDIDAVGIPSIGNRHDTKHFSLISNTNLHADMIREIAMVFEATYHAVDNNPFGLAITVPTSKKIPVRLFATMDQYHKAGGPRGSGGVYNSRTREILIPLPQAGFIGGGRSTSAVSGGILQARRPGYVQVGGNLDPGIIIHEITHALTHDWLGIAPMWFNEGFAEYMGGLPYQNGQLDPAGRKANLLKQVPRMFGGAVNSVRFHTPRQTATMSVSAFRGNFARTETPVLLPTFFDVDFSKPPTPFFKEPEPIVQSTLPPKEMTDAERSLFASVNYASSLALVYHLAETGQADALRRYLFDFLHFEWDRNRYIVQFEKEANAYQANLQQIGEEFQKKIDSYNTAVTSYNLQLASLGSNDTPPEKPVEPLLPENLKAPEILAVPRPPESFSKSALRVRALEKHLQLPPSFSMIVFQ